MLNLYSNFDINFRSTLDNLLVELRNKIRIGLFDPIFERGITNKHLDDFIQGIYYDFSEKKLYKLECETYHGSGGSWGEYRVNFDDLTIVCGRNQPNTLWSLNSELFFLTSADEFVKDGHLLNHQEVQEYFQLGSKYLEELANKLRLNKNLKRVLIN